VEGGNNSNVRLGERATKEPLDKARVEPRTTEIESGGKTRVLVAGTDLLAKGNGGVNDKRGLEEGRSGGLNYKLSRSLNRRCKSIVKRLNGLSPRELAGKDPSVAGAKE